jgi:hypothetical protein
MEQSFFTYSFGTDGAVKRAKYVSGPETPAPSPKLIFATMKYFSKIDDISGRARKASSWWQASHHEAPKTKNMAFLLAAALTLASFRTSSALLLAPATQQRRGWA